MQRQMILIAEEIGRLNGVIISVKEIVSQHSRHSTVLNNNVITATTTALVPVATLTAKNGQPNAAKDKRDKRLRERSKSVCDICNKKLSGTSQLQRHMKVTHGPPTVPCPKCSMKFGRSDYVKRHLKKVHGDGSGRAKN